MQEEKQQGSAADGAAHIAQGAQAAYSVISAARAGSTAAGAAVGTATAGPLGTVVGFLVTTKTFWKILGAVFAAILLFLFIIVNFIGILCHFKGVFVLSHEEHGFFGDQRSHQNIVCFSHQPSTSSTLATAAFVITSFWEPKTLYTLMPQASRGITPAMLRTLLKTFSLNSSITTMALLASN